jgi:hypothetical protein
MNRLTVFGLLALVFAACSDGAPTAPVDLERIDARSGNGSNTLQICHTMGHGGFRMMRVNPDSRGDHLSHGDWLPLTFYEDQDSDGYGGSASILACALPVGYVDNSLDCDDDDRTSYPGAPGIVGDDADNDCDGFVDENWPSWGEVATEAARAAARTWMAGANVKSDACRVDGPLALAGPHSVSGPSVVGKVEQALLDAGAASAVASGWDVAFSQAWHGWSEAITIPWLPWYAWTLGSEWYSLAWYPGPYAGPTPNIPTPLSTMVSVYRSRMEAGALADRVTSSIGSDAGESGAASAIDAFASAIATRFDASLEIPVTMVWGWGLVPTWNPPWGPPAGPVVRGTCWGGDFPTAPWN